MGTTVLPSPAYAVLPSGVMAIGPATSPMRTGLLAMLVAVLIAVTVPGSAPTTSAILPLGVIAIVHGHRPTLTGAVARESLLITVTVSESQLATYTVTGFACLDAPLATGIPQAALAMPTANTSSVTLTAT